MRILIFFLLLLRSIFGSSQPMEAFIAYEDHGKGAIRMPLFDKEEIKRRGIIAAYLVRHPMSWQSEDWSKKDSLVVDCPCSYNDTVSVYEFDDQGTLRRYTNKYVNQIMTVTYDTTGENTRHLSAPDSTEFRIHTRTRILESDSIVESTIWLRFSQGLDTAYTLKKRFDKKGQLREVISKPNIRNNPQWYDNHNGEYDYHHLQDFDEQGRLIYFSNLKAKTFTKISYPDFGRVEENFDSETRELRNSYAIIITKVGYGSALSITTGQSSTVLTYLQKGSKLFKLRTKISHTDHPILEYDEILYQYRNETKK